MNKKIQVIHSVLSVIIAALLTLLNFFCFLSYFGLSKDFIEKISMMVYLSVAQIALTEAEERYFTHIECTFANNRERFNIDNSLEFDLPRDEEEHGTIYLKIWINGSADCLGNIDMKIFFPEWVDISVKQNNYIKMKDDHCCIIELKNIITKGQKNDIDLEKIISFPITRNCPSKGETFHTKIEIKKKGKAKILCFIKANEYKILG